LLFTSRHLGLLSKYDETEDWVRSKDWLNCSSNDDTQYGKRSDAIDNVLVFVRLNVSDD
jgi:hypothetical protein